MTRWGVATLVALLVIGAAGVVVARWFGASGSRAAALVAVAAQWIAAWVLWTFAGGLLLQAGVFRTYEPAIFALVALAGGWLQYRLIVQGAHDRARAVFVGAQLAWLVVLLVQNRLV